MTHHEVYHRKGRKGGVPRRKREPSFFKPELVFRAALWYDVQTRRFTINLKKKKKHTHRSENTFLRLVHLEGT